MEVKDIMTEPVCIDKSATLSYALDLIEKKGTRRLLVTNDGKIAGILTMRNLTKELGTRKKGSIPASSLHVATAVSDNYVKLLPDTKVRDAVTLMARNGGVIIVVDCGKVLGWVTPTELLMRTELQGYAAEVMQKEPIVAHPGDRVSHVRRVMLDNDIGRVPVVDDGKLVGIVTEKDIVKAMRSFRDIVDANKQDARIKNLIVEDIMKMSVKTAYSNAPIRDVVKLMLDENIGGVPIVNLEEQLVGIVTRRCIVNRLAQ